MIGTSRYQAAPGYRVSRKSRKRSWAATRSSGRATEANPCASRMRSATARRCAVVRKNGSAAKKAWMELPISFISCSPAAKGSLVPMVLTLIEWADIPEATSGQSIAARDGAMA